jgi:hypothetical protein
MPDRKRLHLCGLIGLVVAAFGLIAAIVAQPLLSAVWQPQITTAELLRAR